VFVDKLCRRGAGAGDDRAECEEACACQSGGEFGEGETCWRDGLIGVIGEFVEVADANNGDDDGPEFGVSSNSAVLTPQRNLHEA
jgi:hypothetical protein